VAFAELVAPLEFPGRSYHPPVGPVSSMLSFGYTLLYNRMATMLHDRGFNPRLGFFHQGRGAHAALASDLVEELRHIVDRVVLALVHKGEVKPDDFEVAQRRGVNISRLKGEGFRKFIGKFEGTMASKASYHGGERLSYNAYLDEIADNLRRALKLGIPYRALRID